MRSIQVHLLDLKDKPSIHINNKVLDINIPGGTSTPLAVKYLYLATLISEKLDLCPELSGIFLDDSITLTDNSGKDYMRYDYTYLLKYALSQE